MKKRRWKAWFENGLARRIPLMVTDEDMQAVVKAYKLCGMIGWDVTAGQLARISAAMETWKRMPKHIGRKLKK